MLTYFCKACDFHYRETELLANKRCPECKEQTKPRLVLGGQVIGRRT